MRNSNPKYRTTVSFFCSDNQKYSFEAVKTWTSEDTLRTAGQASSSVLDCDKLVFPVHLPSGHWTLAVLDLEKHTATYYDSLWVRLFVSMCWLEAFLNCVKFLVSNMTLATSLEVLSQTQGMLLQCGDGGVLRQLLRFVQDVFRVERGVSIDTSIWEQRHANPPYMQIVMCRTFITMHCYNHLFWSDKMCAWWYEITVFCWLVGFQGLTSHQGRLPGMIAGCLFWCLLSTRREIWSSTSRSKTWGLAVPR